MYYVSDTLHHTQLHNSSRSISWQGMGTTQIPSALTSCFVLFLLHSVYVTVTTGAIASGEANYYTISYLCFKTSVVHICQQFLLLGRMAINWYRIHIRAWIFQSFTSITGSPPKKQATVRTTTSVIGLLQTLFQQAYRLLEKTEHITHEPCF